MPDKDSRYRAIRRATLFGALINIVLAVLKVLFGFISQSHALISDGLHSFADLATDVVVVYAAKRSKQDADEKHPYGHARIETAFTVALGLLLIILAMGLMVDAGRRLLTPAELMHPGVLALAVALVSIFAKEALYHYTLRVARKVRSKLLHTNAWHHRSDAISSIVVLVGISGSLIGFDYLDAFASVGVALLIAKIGWDAAWQALLELVDTGLNPERVKLIRDVIEEVDGVRDLHMLRTRRMGGDALVDVHVQVDPRLSVSEGHQIGEYVRNQLLENIDEVSDVTVHIDSEDDQASDLSAGLPLRRTVLRQLRECWQSIIDPALIQAVSLHYLSGKIQVDVVLPLRAAGERVNAEALAEELARAAAKLPHIGPVRVYFSPSPGV